MVGQCCYHTITADQLIGFMCATIGKNYKPVFDQYLHHTSIPTFVYAVKQKGADVELQYKWNGVIPTFSMPVWVNVAENEMIRITPAATVQTMLLKNREARDFKLEETAYLVNIKKGGCIKSNLKALRIAYTKILSIRYPNKIR